MKKGRRRVTQIFPWLLPLRRWQRKACFYAGMRLDGRRYAKELREDRLPCELYGAHSLLYNHETGFDMKYQENKVFNLKLAAAELNGLMIRPGETFSFWKQVRYADRAIPYREGLVVSDGTLKALYGGGLCQMSNLLFWLFLHTPLTIMERHGHSVREFPETPGEIPPGIDATVSEGWLDLKVRNDTKETYQIVVSFDEEYLTGQILMDKDDGIRYRVTGENLTYQRESGRVYEKIDIMQKFFSIRSKEISGEKLLYQNRCEIKYPLPWQEPGEEGQEIIVPPERRAV